MKYSLIGRVCKFDCKGISYICKGSEGGIIVRPIDSIKTDTRIFDILELEEPVEISFPENQNSSYVFKVLGNAIWTAKLGIERVTIDLGGDAICSLYVGGCHFTLDSPNVGDVLFMGLKSDYNKSSCDLKIRYNMEVVDGV